MKKRRTGSKHAGTCGKKCYSSSKAGGIVVMNTSGRNRIKPDTVLKNFWRDNARFADLFNAALFNGESVIQPDELEEVDTDISALLKVGGHVDTLQRVFDVAKKSTYGVDFVILGLENQQHIHLGMPLRVMMGDALGYYKEYGEIVKKTKTEAIGTAQKNSFRDLEGQTGCIRC